MGRLPLNSNSERDFEGVEFVTRFVTENSVVGEGLLKYTSLSGMKRDEVDLVWWRW
jgi:hypothetical protein